MNSMRQLFNKISENFAFSKSKILPAVFLMLPFMIQSCGSKPKEASSEKTGYNIPDSVMKTIVLDTVIRCPLSNCITLTGIVDFDQENQINIYPMVSGNVQDVHAQVGDFVKAGQTLAVVKSSEMANYSNNLSVAETNLKSAKKQLDVTTDMYKSGLSSQLEVTNAQANYEQATSQLEAIKRILKINGNNTQGDYIIKAPISGFVVQKNITNSTFIRPDNGVAIFTISDLKKVWVQANVYESNIDNVHLGDSVNITTLSYPDRIFRGKIDKVLNVLEPTNKVMKVRIVLRNEDYALKPSMFASVQVTNKTNKESICISNNSLVFDHSQYFVLKYNGKNSAEITPVKVQSLFGNRVYLSEGVNTGDKLIGSQTLLIYDALNN
jgi:cobalt-zinc-cadmium efflux system membrane fusion protein